MDVHESLYKSGLSQFLSSRLHNKTNRELQDARRIKERRARFQESRNILLSPTPKKKEMVLEICSEDKENLNDNCIEENQNSTRVAKIICNTTNAQKLTKQEAFLKRYIEWKENKKVKKQQEQSNKKKPFISAVNSGGRQTTTSSSLVPRGHHKEFRPPAGLKIPQENEKLIENKKADVKGRVSIYTVVPTPPRKTEVREKLLNKFPIARKALPSTLHTRISNSNKTTNEPITNLSRSTSKITTTNKLNNKTPGGNKKTTTKVIAKTSPIVDKPPIRKDLKPRIFKIPPPSVPTRATAEKCLVNKKKDDIQAVGSSSTVHKQAGAAGKMRTLLSKRTEDMKAKNLKAKKAPTKFSMPAIQTNGKKLLNLCNNQQVEDMVIQTPKDFATLNPFKEFVTSTKVKNSSHTLEELEGISPIEISQKRPSGNSSAKRNIMQDAINSIQTESHGKPPKDQYEILSNKADGALNIKKYNFIRYSEIANTSLAEDSKADNDITKQDREEKISTPSEEINKTLVKTSVTDEKTPTKSGLEERAVNYLSPFVSVSRGKVSLKKEKEKRDSIYLQNPVESCELNSVNLSTTSPKYSVEVRRTLEAVRYFRKQLQDEIDRLHHLCNIWESYKIANLEKIQNANGEDMINVTIGQTRLLTSKKFMQFKGLIDRCEAGATGIGAVEYDGSEDTKPITSVDLEGFWSMLGLQVDNLDKRFDSLNRWKMNDWIDPDEIKPKVKKNLTKVKKTKIAPASKAKPSLALQQMLRKMQEMRKNKNKNDETNMDVIIIPSQQKQRRSVNSNNSTPRKSNDNIAQRRLSIVVKDRKYFSPAATVISVASPNCRASLNQRKSPQDSPKMLKHMRKFNEALENMESNLNLRKSVLISGTALNSQSIMTFNESNARKASPDFTTQMEVNAKCKDEETSKRISLSEKSSFNSPAPTGRKSILKTPGTAKSRLRNVIFNEKLRVKKFNFLISEDGDGVHITDEDGTNDTHEEDLSKNHEDDEAQIEGESRRTLTLRNRKVCLRPSSEIVIPLK